MTALHEVSALGGERSRLADDDPEAAHGIMDDMARIALRAVARNEPDAKGAAQFVYAMVLHEERMGWRRWYA